MTVESLSLSLSEDSRLISLLRRYFAFHLICFSLILGQLFAFIHLISAQGNSILLATLLASLVLSSFTYLILHFYLQTRKGEQFDSMCTGFIEKQSSPHETELHIANAAYSLAASLEGREFELFPRGLKKISFLITWKDFITMRELLLLVSVRQHVDLIKHRPTDLEAHASLANTYVAIAKLYLPPTAPELAWTHRFFQREPLVQRFKEATEKALQEFEIINTYAPEDPWVHAQLALCYHDLHMFAEEIQAYEKILSLCPDDKEVMYRLGILYFRQGMNAKGLRIYDELLRLGFSRCDQLLSYYDAHHL